MGATLPPNPGELIESHAMEALHQTLSGAGAPLLGVIANRLGGRPHRLLRLLIRPRAVIGARSGFTQRGCVL
jgi:hypothetical protein